MKALDMFHETFPDSALAINVTRHPYSFIGDAKPGQSTGLSKEGTWHSGLVEYTDGTERGARQAEEMMQRLAAHAGIRFDYSVRTHWQPIESQRALLWAGRFGKQEEFMSALNLRHFERAQSASERATILAACEEVGLDTAAAVRFLDSDDLVAHVWHSYGSTIRDKGVRAIPFLVFNVPAAHRVGGPFRDRPSPSSTAKEPYVINGSMDARTFFELFVQIRNDTLHASV